MPDDMRTKDPSFTWEPLLQYGGSAFSIQFGPRVISLITRPHHYPGWSCFEEELAWVFEQLEASGIISEIERIGLRYVDFFENDVWPKLNMGVQIAGNPCQNGELSTTVVLRHPEGMVRLQVANGAFFQAPSGVKRGSVIDLDVWHPGGDGNHFSDGLVRVKRLHDTSKEIFFGLLKPEILATMNPVYPAT